MTTPSADESARIMTAHLRAQEPFTYWRFGDGALELIYGTGVKTCDGEVYSHEMREALLAELKFGMTSAFSVYLGDWTSATFGRRRWYRGQMIGCPTHLREWISFVADQNYSFLNFEALVMHRESAALPDFYRAVREDERSKLYVGPWTNADGARMLGAEMLIVPDSDLFRRIKDLECRLRHLRPEVLLFGAGIAGVILCLRYWREHPAATVIHLGSALDILFRGRTRSQQIDRARARQLFREFL